MKKTFLLQKNSFLYKGIVFSVAIILIQSLFLTAVLVGGGVLKQTKLNSYEAFSSKVQGRGEYLELEIKNRWTNVEPFLVKISRVLSKDYETDTQLFEDLSPDMIEMLRNTKTTGIFVMLIDDENDTDVSGLYFRDYDPMYDNASFKDLYLMVGPSDIATKLQISLDQNWSYNLRLNDNNQDFIKKPLGIADLSKDPKLLGYWSKPFKLFENDLQIMTYSMPIFDEDDNLKGIIGIETTINHMMRMLPATDSGSKESLGYIITHRDMADAKPVPSVIVNSIQRKYLPENEPFDIETENEEFKIYKLLNHNAEYDIYFAVHELELYNRNTPFENESWYLLGFMRDKELFSYLYRVQTILISGFIIALIAGILGSGYFSYKFSKPVINLSDKIRESDKNEILVIEPTGILEVDILAKEMQEASKERVKYASKLTEVISLLDLPIAAFEIKNDSNDVFATEKFYTILGLNDKSKETFINGLNELVNNPLENEEDVYKIGEENPRWVKLKIKEFSGASIGVIQDITEELKEKFKIQRDRDIDPLTRLLNRQSFKTYMEQLLKKHPLKCAALVMFDLDNLKTMNDTYGHKWGDIYIKEAVQKLGIITQRNKMLLGRRSGDEFILLLYGFNSKKEIEDCMDEFFEYVKGTALNLPDGKTYSIGMSAGLEWIEEWPTDYEELLNKADELLYISKFNNKGHWTKS